MSGATNDHYDDEQPTLGITCAGGDLRRNIMRSAIPECTKLFFDNNMLDYNQPLTDGFYDGGRSVPTLQPLETLRSQQPHTGRDIILLDTRDDFELRATLEKIMNSLRDIPDIRPKVQALSVLVSNYFGGSNKDLISNTEKGIWNMKQLLFSNVVPIGKLQFGVCRHRAVVFKYVADQLRIPCRLVRGDYLSENGTEGHAWNIVLIDGKNLLCDIMHDPGVLYDDDSEKAVHYKRIAKQEGALRYAGGAGMQSLPVPHNVKSAQVAARANDDSDLVKELQQQLATLKFECAIKDIQLERIGARLLEVNPQSTLW